MEICKKHRGEKIIIFNQFNDQTNKLYWYLLEVGINCRVLHSGIKKEERQQAISDFKLGKINVLAATKVLDEGWNVPAVQVAIIMAGDSTAKQTIQRLGRILRKQKDKGNSILYQVYCRGTMEEEHSNERAKLFKQLSSHFNDYNYRLDSELNLEDKRK